MGKTRVSIVKGPKGTANSQEEIDKLLDRTFELLGGVDNLIGEEKTVVLKPNAGHVNYPEESVDTNPMVMSAIIHAIKKVHPNQKFVIAEAGAMGVVTMEALEASGMIKVAEEEGAEVWDLKAEGIPLYNYKVPNPMSKIKQIQLPKCLADPNVYLINVPIMKAHTCCMFTNALKNLKGCVQDHHHFIMHCTNLMGAMFDLGEALRPDLNIADMIKPLEGFGPHSGFPVEYDTIVASTDIAATDVVCATVASIPLENLEYMEMAKKKPLGEYDINNMELVGDPLDQVKRHMYVPYLKGWENWPDYHIHLINACSSCQSLVSYTMARITGMGKYDEFAGTHIIAGRVGELPEDVKPGDPYLLFGDCTETLWKKLKDQGVPDNENLHVTGCPPSEPYPYWVLEDKVSYGEREDLRERNTRDLQIFNKWMETERQKLEESGELQGSIKLYSAE